MLVPDLCPDDVRTGDTGTASAETCSVAPSCPEGDLGPLLHRAAAMVRAQFDRTAREHGLADMRDWLVLRACAEAGRHPQHEVALRLGLDKTTLTAVLDRLERAGHLVREHDPKDRRVRIPRTTAPGLAVVSAVAADREHWQQQILAGLGEDRSRALLTDLAEVARLAAAPPAGQGGPAGPACTGA